MFLVVDIRPWICDRTNRLSLWGSTELLRFQRSKLLDGPVFTGWKTEASGDAPSETQKAPLLLH